jgi:outer membrane receptor protein involved in Fe transport
VPEEILDSYEIGWKQRFLDRRVSLNAAFYYGLWDNKKSRQIYPINFTCDNSPAIPGTTPGCRGATTVPGEAVAGQPARNADGSPALQNSNVVAPLDVKIWGAEFEATAAITDRFQLGGALTYAKSEMQTGFFVTVASIAGSSNITGNANPRFPEWSGSINGTYTAPLNDDWNWYVRGDANYFGKTYVDLDNFATCKGYVLANGRAGVEKEGVRVELFVKNLFDDDSWAACARFLEFDLPQDGAGNPNIYQTVIVAPQLKRQIGLRASWKF